MPSSLRFAFSRHTWLLPIIFILVLAALFPSIYLSATADPQGHLHDMPIALVVEPQTSMGTDFAATVATSIRDHNAGGKLDLERMDAGELHQKMAHDQVAGAIVIPATFNRDVQTLLPGNTGAVMVPTVTVRTNAADGGISNGLVTGNVTPLLTGVQQGFGKQLVGSVASAGAPTTAAGKYLLAAPFQVQTSAYTPLPKNAGLGTGAFYYTLILVLLGFVGATVVNAFIDSVLGFAPSEFGPLVARRPYTAITRRQTLLVKFGIIIVVAPVAALIVELVAHFFVGVPVSAPVQLWGLSAAAIAAIGVSALTVFSIFGGGIGSLVNTLFFIALSMTASGGTVPLTAVSPFFGFLATFEPFRPIVGGVRAILYFHAAPEAGLATAWLHVGIGGVIGIVLGLFVTTLYAKKRMFTRHPRPATASTATADASAVTPA